MNNNQIQFKCVFRYSLVQCLYYYCGALSISLNGSSDGRDVSPLATPATPAFSHPFMRWHFPSLLVKWLYRLTSQVACKGFKTDNLRSTSMSSSFPVASICFCISAEYHIVNWSFMKRFASPFTVRSRGWKKCVMLAGTETTSIFSDANFDKTLSVFWPLNTSQMSSAFWVGCSFSSFRFRST